MEQRKIVNNQYLILDKIGTGGAATVYKAWDNMLQKFVAIKKIHDEFAADAKYVDMFRKEAVNTAKLEHENIVRVVNFIRDTDAGLYIVMDYVKGVDCEYLISKARKKSVKIPVEIALYIIGEIVKALDYAHDVKDELTSKAMNIIHRDISPGNLLLSFDGRVKLTDFGIAKAGGDHQQEKDKLAGKISYMSPEQALNTVLDLRSDLFSCGLIMYELLLGEKAYKNEDKLELWQSVKNADIDFKKIKNSDIPADVQNIMKKIFQKSPEQRYKNAAEFFIAIKQFLSKIDKTEGLRSKYNNFIQEFLAEEIRANEKVMNKLQNLDYRSEFQKAMKKNSVPVSPAQVKVKSTEEDAKDDSAEKLKSWKSYVVNKKTLFTAAVVLFSMLTADVVFQTTFLGTGLHQIIWAPALKVDSRPSDSKIEIIKNGKDIIKKKGFINKTPFYLKKVKTGSYILKFQNDEYGELQRGMTVFGQKKGSQSISIIGAKQIEDIYVVPFEVEIEVLSEPTGADVYIDGNKVGQTPFMGTIEVGRRNFVLLKEGYRMLGTKTPERGFINGVCFIDTLLPADKQNNIDYSFWDVENQAGESFKKKFKITGELIKI